VLYFGFGIDLLGFSDMAQETLPPSVTASAQAPSPSATASVLSSDIEPVMEVPFDGRHVPTYKGEPYVAVHDNVPYFTEEEKALTVPFEKFSPLDSLGRCGVVYANVCEDLMPTKKRGDIGHIRPTGWVSVQYDFVDGKSLYNRCHLLGHQLTGEDDNEMNLITGTRSMNTQGMLPFENLVADYVKETGNHVLYRVTPVFIGENLVADGVLMEGWSVEDEGEGVCFAVYAFNREPGVEIDYATGESRLS